MRLSKLYKANEKPHDRYVVVGTSGSGKSTLADRLAWQVGCRHVELDALFWLPSWEMRPTGEFRQLVTKATAADRWVVVVFHSSRPVRRELSALGVELGMVLIVHSSLSSLGWVCGGSQTVVEALQEILGPQGTLVMPTHTSHLTDPAGWQNPPVPESWWEPIRQEMPAYNPALTTTCGMGAIPEAFRKGTGVRRSDHPQLSVDGATQNVTSNDDNSAGRSSWTRCAT